ncbi:uncharacterized protein BX663DRAFT_506209 [Cokeromyces recurvatus]|uniref:uncharacterized protein n=1 Tax=Cokeromyces recurvatus TaxID=90255 RepID=UPI002220E9A0|nr:uncharacterized protein BX663DRAFT_506209 [Cokeromyces recurvatus]KAI7904048.1 hypothetical protein BX663DRAFT_506209 [Cokeromyces recurvatus]
MTDISLPSNDIQTTILKNPALSSSVKIGHNNFDNLIAYTAIHVKTLLKCSKERHYYQQRLLPTLPIFIRHIFYHCKLTPTILIIAIIYLGRLKSNLPRKSRGEFDTPYKMFIAAVILASKFAEDSNKIAHSIYRLVAPLYNHKEINEMERSFLGVVQVME